MDIVKGFDSLTRAQAQPFASDRSLTFQTRRDLVQHAAITLECGPHILHAGAGLFNDACFDYPGLNWSGAPEDMIDVRLRLSPLILARLADLGAAEDMVWVRSSLNPFPLAAFKQSDIPDNFVTPAYLGKLKEKVGRNHWWTGACFVRDGQMHVHGWAIPPRNWKAGLPEVRIDGTIAAVSPAVSPWARDTYWALGGQYCVGFYAVGACHPEGLYSKIQVSFGAADSVENIRRFAVYQLTASLDRFTLPVPPDANIHRVSGPGANQYTYLNGGKSDFERFRILIREKLGRSSLAGLKVLDWGVGCGRLARYFIEEGALVTGVDIDDGNIAWCKANLVPGEFVTVELMPPTPLAADSFDVIISSSVLSHLKEPVMHAWLSEMMRVLKPDGVALLSFNGDGNAYLYGAGHPPAIAALDGYGFFDEWRTPDLDGAVEGAEDYYRFTIMSDSRAKTIFEANATLEGFAPGVTSMHQDIAVLRKLR